MNLILAVSIPAPVGHGLFTLHACPRRPFDPPEDGGEPPRRPAPTSPPRGPGRPSSPPPGFSSSILKVTLAQRELAAELRQSLIDALRFGSAQWALLEEIELPSFLPPTGDPVLLALRRLIRKDPAGLGASHREALEKAESRPDGLRRLIFEEALKADQESGGPLPGPALLVYRAHFPGAAEFLRER